jgi:hypothetical protein
MLFELLCCAAMRARKATRNGRSLSLPTYLAKWEEDLDDLVDFLLQEENGGDSGGEEDDAEDDVGAKGKPGKAKMSADERRRAREEKEAKLRGLASFLYTAIKLATNPNYKTRPTVDELIRVRTCTCFVEGIPKKAY